MKWPWPLIRDVLPLCQAAFGGGYLEIAPRYLPIDNIPAFTDAARPIYMTATLADDGILVSHFQADPEEVVQPIRPKGGGDIGDRMILAPPEVNPDITVDEIKEMAHRRSKGINVCVIVSSKERAKYWADVADQTLDKDTIESGAERLRKGHVGGPARPERDHRNGISIAGTLSRDVGAVPLRRSEGRSAGLCRKAAPAMEGKIDDQDTFHRDVRG